MLSWRVIWHYGIKFLDYIQEVAETSVRIRMVHVDSHPDSKQEAMLA